MNLKSYAMEIEEAAEISAVQARAVHRCPTHPDMTIRNGNEVAERHAYALMGVKWMQQGCDDDRDAWIDALSDYLGQAQSRCRVCELAAVA